MRLVTFTSTAIEVTGDNTGKITGDLTLNGVTKSVVLDAKLNKSEPYPLPALRRQTGGRLHRNDHRSAVGFRRRRLCPLRQRRSADRDQLRGDGGRVIVTAA